MKTTHRIYNLDGEGNDLQLRILIIGYAYAEHLLFKIWELRQPQVATVQIGK